ncbi:MAG TPA: chemotaxis protein CheB [Candidatus Eisenbacteria bacterium]|nr:chemotaxis protein CheB [Candidatus Eisenbacteria bacterium]
MTQDDEHDLGHLVVVGSSAGGIEALGVLVSGLTPDFPAPVVLAQHLDPSRPSMLPGILERRTKVPVETLTENTKLQRGHVYVVPSNRHVVIQDGTVGLEQDNDDRPLPSIDLLFSTAARVYRERLIAVILTGSGSDGADGAIEVKERGGCVVIQDPRTAAHPSMPSSLPPTLVDHVADLDKIAPLLQDILKGTTIERRIETAHSSDLDEILGILTRQGSIDFRQYKSTTILRRLSRRMALNHIHGLEEYRDFLALNPQEVAMLVRSLLIKVTEFFRDADAFAVLEREIMPELIERGRGRGRVLRLWSAGCATGEEAYSLGLMVSHMLGRELPEWSIKIFATDADGDAIAYARRGVYPATVLRSLPAEYKARYFEPLDQGLRISKALRQMIIFGQQDLAQGVPFPRIDLVSCRNLLIYFKPELQQAVLDLFAYSLQQTHGFLFLGKAETARPSRSTYEIVNKKWKVYRCLSGPLPIAVRPRGEKGRGESPAVSGPATLNAETLQAAGARIPEEVELRRVNELFLRSLSVGVCAIDRSYKILSVNAMARRLFGIREVATDQDFLHTVQGLPYVEIRNAIDRCFRERTVTVLPQVELTDSLGEARFLAIQLIPFEGLGVETALICVENVTELVQTQRRLEAVQSEQSQLAQELGTANHRLMDMNRDLQDANEELQATNEEMMLTQEELQATNEEFEATNEELQATNEELETNNEELQATNEELETTNEELHARTSELQELTRALSNERSRLTQIVEQAPFHVLLLRGPSLIVEDINPPLIDLFPGTKSGQTSFEDVTTDPALLPVRAGVRNAFVNGRPWQSGWIRVGQPMDLRFYQFTAVPTHDSGGKVDGIVLYAEDVTARRIHEEAEKLSRLRLMLEHASQLAMGLFNAEGKLVHASQQFLGMLQRLRKIDPAHAIGMDWERLWFGAPDLLDTFQTAVSEGRAQRLNEVQIEGDPQRAVWDCSLIPITPEGGGAVDFVVVTAVEVTRPVLAREAVEQVDRLRDNFLSLASHELRTPLTPLAAYIEVLAHLLGEKSRTPDWERQVQDVIGKFRRQIGYMSRLTEDLVDISRIRSGKLTLDRRPVDLRHAVEEGRDQALALGANARVQVTSADADLTVHGDEMRLAQVVYNLLSNAMKHASASERIEVRLSEKRDNGRAWGRVEVCDEGPGIPEEYRDDLFLHFVNPTRREGRAARSGLGLGLFISARIVEQHEGRIGVEDLEHGTCIWFEIPLIDARVGASTPPAPRN